MHTHTLTHSNAPAHTCACIRTQFIHMTYSLSHPLAHSTHSLTFSFTLTPSLSPSPSPPPPTHPKNSLAVARRGVVEARRYRGRRDAVRACGPELEPRARLHHPSNPGAGICSATGQTSADSSATHLRFPSSRCCSPSQSRATHRDPEQHRAERCEQRTPKAVHV
jgi:hypothetical protein